MSGGLIEIRASIQKNLDEQVGGQTEKDLRRLAGCIDRGLEESESSLEKVAGYVEDLREIDETLDPGKTNEVKTNRARRHRFEKREAKFQALRETFQKDEDPVRQDMGAIMERFEPGLFAGGHELDTLQDNLELERWFRLPKSHERKIHGRQHAGVRIVQEGPGLTLTLDAHHSHRRPFTEEELSQYLGATPTQEELEAVERRKIMRRATSRKLRPSLLEDLEKRYRSELPGNAARQTPTGS